MCRDMKRADMVQVKEGECVSVIIPVYNVIDCFEECMQSVLEQTYENIEIVLVNDGSNDGSEKLCDLYEKRDSRVRVLHQKNSGQAIARNIGVDISKGDYIAFVDSDDVLDKHYIEFLLEGMLETGADISVCAYEKFSKNYKTRVQKLNTNNYIFFETQEALEELCYQKRIDCGPCSKLLKKELIKDIRFPANIGYEDFATIYKYIANAKKIVVLDNILYFYRQRETSTMHMKFSRKKLDRLPISDEILEFVKEKYPEIEEAAIARMFLSNLQVVMDMPLKREFQLEWRLVKKNIEYARKCVLTNKKVKRIIRIMAVCSYMGIVPLKILGVVYGLLINKILKC